MTNTYVKLEDVCVKESSNIAQKDLIDVDGGYPIYGAAGLIKCVNFFKQGKEYIAIVKDGAGVGRVMLLPAYSSVIGTLQYIVPNDRISIKYLFYALEKMNLAKYSTGATIPHIYFKDYKNEVFRLPELAEQEQVVNRLSKIDELLQKRKAQLEKLDLLVKSQFIEMFGDPTNNVFGYPLLTLKEVSKRPLSYGSTESAVAYDGQVRYVRITDITDFGGLGDDAKSAAHYDEKYLLHEGDILFARTGATVGKTCIYHEKYGKAIYAGFLIRLIPNTEIVEPEYLFHFTKSDFYWEFVRSAQRVVAQPNINAQEYGDLQILIPEKGKQKQFAKFVQQTDKTKIRIKQSLEKLETLKKALMQKYFG